MRGISAIGSRRFKGESSAHSAVQNLCCSRVTPLGARRGTRLKRSGRLRLPVDRRARLSLDDVSCEIHKGEKMMRAALVIFSVLGLGLTGCDGGKTPKTDQEKYSYSIGYQFAKNLKQQNVPFDAGSVKTAINDVANGKESQVN